MQWGTLYPTFGNLGIIAITYSIISPLVLGFAMIGLGVIYLATRYNSMYVYNNNIDTKGLAYAKALQQLMTGVYLSEVCLIGLFAINTAPGPIVLMAVFLGATVIYHVTMNRALEPFIKYLPESTDGSDLREMFKTEDNKSYDASRTSTSPSESQRLAEPKGLNAKKTALFGKFFDPSKFKSHAAAQKLVPDWAPPLYEEEEANTAYYNPCISSSPPPLWIAKDEMGISAREIQESSQVNPITDEYARFDGPKGKIVWNSPDEGGNLRDVPIYEKRIEY
jgi:hypothetical protein